MSRSILVSVLVGGALAGAGCADYAYRAHSATGAPTPLASYSIPPASPHGQVQLRSPGVQPLPTPEVPAGGRRSVDLYYALPAGQARERDLPRFDARWHIDTANGPLQGQATFQRVNLAGPTMPCGPHAAEYCLAGYGA